MTSIRLIVTGCLMAAGSLTAGAQAQPVLVTAKWLEGRLADPRIAVVHVAGGRAEYDAGHLVGARFLPLSSVSVQSDGLSAQLAPIAQIDSVLEATGISDGQHVVLYGQALTVARAFVTLERVGLQGRVSVLDGGLDFWRESGRQVSREPVSLTRGSFTPRTEAMVVDAPWIQNSADNPRIKVLDARVPEFFLGVSAGQTARAGHIPGARNVPFSSLTGELTTMREPGKIKRLFEQAGVAKGDTVVTYCHIGMQASLLYLAARSLGYPARIYDGSYEDWAKRPELPVVVRK
ncbi:MAG: sulfurtransferase [Gemmatimonadaceae bacterium]